MRVQEIATFSEAEGSESTGVHEIAGPKNLTPERFGRNSKLERQSNMTKIETPYNIA
jgi:hypothetical protein